MTGPADFRESTDALDPARATAFCATLGLDPTILEQGNLPPFWHYLYFWEARPADALGRDGHPKTGDFIPDLGLPRRMWAGGDLRFLHPLKLAQPATRKSHIADVRQKTGRSGPFALVEVAHEFWQGDTLCVRERQDLIYRKESVAGAPAPTPPKARVDETQSRTVSFSSTLLFRYSALTFNGHRIHYDRDYCTAVEGYPGLVVHGPLLAQMLIHLAMETIGSITSFKFRATAPLFDFETATLCAAPVEGGLDLWVRGPDGRQNMVATAS